jgi:hypothetical protein
VNSPDQTLQILIDVRSRLDEVVKAQGEFRKMREEVTGAGQALKTGFGIELARRGLDLLTHTFKELAIEAVNMADAIKDGARNLTISNQAYQVLGNLLHDAGGDVSMLTQAISNNNRSLVEARTAGTNAAAAYRTLGLNVAEMAQLPIERRFELIARAVENATDKDRAFTAAGQILVSRNLPTLLGALKDLAAEGWDKVADSMQRAGRIMTDDTIERLERAKKSIEKLKQAATIGVGEWLGDAMSLGSAVKRVFDDIPFALMGSIIKPGSTGALFGQVWHDFIKEPGTGAPAPTAGGSSAAREIELKDALAKAEFNLAAAILHRQTIENDPNITGLSVQARQLDQMQQELRLRVKLIAAKAATPLEGTETQEARDLALKKMQEQNQQLRDQIRHLTGSNQFNDAATSSRDKFNTFRTDSVENKQGIGSGFMTGAMDWVTGLGSAGQQVASALQSSLGATVGGISDGIYGWITGTESFGQAALQLGGTILKTLLDTIIQMGVQWLLTHTIMKTGMIEGGVLDATLRTTRIAGAVTEGTATTAALAPAAATASISSFGLAAVLGIAALVAVMAAFGGFASGGYTGDGPTNQVAGVVHGQEGVLNAPAMRRLGRGFLDAVNAGSPVSVAASAAPALAGSMGASTGGGRESARDHHYYIDREVFAAAMAQDMRGIAHEVYLENLRKGV